MLRDNLFPGGGSQPNVEYQIALAQAPRNAMTKIEIDGNVLEPDKPTPPFRWPGNKSGVKISIVPTSGPNTGQTLDPTQGKGFTGEWGVLRMFAATGDGEATQSQLNVNGLRLSIQPKSGTSFSAIYSRICARRRARYRYCQLAGSAIRRLFMYKRKPYLRAVSLAELFEQLTREVKSSPSNAELRIFLFELLCFDGDWDRAERQLDVIGHQSAQARVGVEGLSE